jgi:putative lipoprotein
MTRIMTGGLLAVALGACATTTAPKGQAAESQVVRSEVVVDLPDQSFICPSGAIAEVRRDAPAGVAIVSYMGETTNLLQEVGKTPPSFVAGSSTLSIEPTQAVLKRGRDKAFACQLRPDQPVRGTLWGTISKMDRMGLVPGTRARVLIVDVSRAGAPAIEIARTEIVTEGNNVPLHFLIRYDESRILPGMSYSLSARIEDARGRLMYITDTFNPLFEAVGEPQPPVDVMLVRVPPSQ